VAVRIVAYDGPCCHMHNFGAATTEWNTYPIAIVKLLGNLTGNHTTAPKHWHQGFDVHGSLSP
jgi:hypothetical protein